MKGIAAALIAVALVALAGCVTAHIDYGLGDVRPVGRGRFQGLAVTLALEDGRYASKKTVGSYAHKKGVYNEGLAFPAELDDYSEVFCPTTARGVQKPAGANTLWYIAPDRLYWKPAGPMDDLRERLAEHLRKAGVFAKVDLPPAAGGRIDGKARLEVALKRFVSLKERRPGIDTFGFLGVSALARSREIVSVKADWRLVDASGRTLDGGKIEFTESDDGSCWRAKNKPFALNNRAARALGAALVKALRP